jgi:hypothetical protein
MNSIKKDVVSSSLQAAEWENSEIISGDVAQGLTAGGGRRCSPGGSYFDALRPPAVVGE